MIKIDPPNVVGALHVPSRSDAAEIILDFISIISSFLI